MGGVVALMAIPAQRGGEAARIGREPVGVAPAARPVATAAQPAPRSAGSAAEVESVPESREAAVRGRVIDAAGTPLAGVPLASADDGRVLASSGEDGSFQLRARTGASIVARGAGWTTLRACLVASGREEARNLVVAAPAMPLAGLVVDDAGAPLPGAAVCVRIDVEALAGFTPAWRECAGVDLCATSDGAGSFRIEAAPVLSAGEVVHAELVASAAGFHAAACPLPAEPREDLRFALVREGGPWLTVRGRALLPDGRPATGAEVRLGGAQARVHVSGEFLLQPVGFAPDTPLVATLDGWQPVCIERFGERLAAPGGPAPVELVFEGAELAIEGRLEDARGEPLKGWRVLVASATGEAGARIPIPDELGTEPRPVRADRSGEFALRGLARGSYVLRATSRDGRASFESEPIPAPARGVVLREPESGAPRTLAGRVVDQTGAPIAGARVGLVRPDVTRPTTAADLVQGTPALTGADGRFALEGVPAHGARVAAVLDGALPAFARTAPSDGPEFELALTRVVALGFGARQGGADSLSALDGSGRTLPLWPGGVLDAAPLERLALLRGGTASFAAPSQVRALVVWSRGVEVGRLDVDPASATALSWP